MGLYLHKQPLPLPTNAEGIATNAHQPNAQPASTPPITTSHYYTQAAATTHVLLIPINTKKESAGPATTPVEIAPTKPTSTASIAQLLLYKSQ